MRVECLRLEWKLNDIPIESRHEQYTKPTDSWREKWLIRYKANTFSKSPLWNGRRMKSNISLPTALQNCNHMQKKDYEQREIWDNDLKQKKAILYKNEDELWKMKKENKKFAIRNNYIPSHQYNNNDTTPINKSITIDEVTGALVSLKNFKAIGSDMITVELLKCCVMKRAEELRENIVDWRDNEDDDNNNNCQGDDSGMSKSDTTISTFGQYNKRCGKIYDSKSKKVRKRRNDFITNATSAVPNAPPPMLTALHQLINAVFMMGSIPAMWRMNIITMLHKKGDEQDPKNFRPINISAIMQKVLNKILATRLQDMNDRICGDIRDKIGEMEREEGNKNTMYKLRRNMLGMKPLWSNNQIAYIRNRDRFEHIATLVEYNQVKMNEKKKAYNIFIDLTRAFDSVAHEKLMHVLDVKLNNRGADTTFMRYIQGMYDNIYYTTKTKNKYSSLKKQRWGIKQGCCISPILFNIYFDLVIAEMEDTFKDEIVILGYADDIIIATENVELIPKIMQTFCDITQRLNMEINMTKSELMQIGESCVDPEGRQRDPVVWPCVDGQKGSMNYVNSYKYLGLVIDYNNKIKVDHATFYAPLFKYANLFFNTMSPQEYKIKMFNTYVMPKILNNAAIFGILTCGRGGMGREIYEEVISKIEKIIMQMIVKKSSNVPLQTCTRLVEYDVLGIQNPRIQIQQQATRLAMDLVERDQMDLNTWLYDHIHAKRTPPEGSQTNLPPLLATIRNIYHNMKTMVVYQQDGYDKTAKVKCWLVDTTPALPPKMQKVIMNRNLDEGKCAIQEENEHCEVMNEGNVFICRNVHEVAKRTKIADPFPLATSNKPHRNHKINVVQRMLKNKLFSDEMLAGRVTMKRYLCGRRYECNATTKMMKISTPNLEKEMLAIQEMRMGKQVGTRWGKEDKKFKFDECSKCLSNVRDDLTHQILTCPHDRGAGIYGLTMFNRECAKHKIKIREHCQTYQQIKEDVKTLQQHLLQKGGEPDPMMQRVVVARAFEKREEYNREINNMSTFINIEYIQMLRNHRSEEWPSKANEMKTRIPISLHWVLEDEFQQIYEMNMFLIENKKIWALYHKDPKKMLSNIKNIVKDEQTLWKYLLCPGGSIIQQNMANLITACLLQSKERCNAIALFERSQQ